MTSSRKYIAILLIETKRPDGMIDVKWSQIFAGTQADCVQFANALFAALKQIGLARNIKIKIQTAREFPSGKSYLITDSVTP